MKQGRKPMAGQTLDRTTPLVSITALVLDTETTGLDPLSDQIIQFGAVRITEGKCDFSNTFEALVKPGIPIPASSTAIHGITDKDIKRATSFETVAKVLDAFHDAPLIIGYSIGFDLAMMKAEYDRNGVKWSPPPSLDVQVLAEVVAPNLPDKSLETLAAWLGIPVEGRHNALADAVMTAKIYKALIPKLAEKSIFTYAEAQRVSNRLAPSSVVEGGWHDIRDEQAIRVRDVHEFARIDSFPYRHEVKDLMHAPAVILKPNTTLRTVLKKMMGDNVSSVFIEPSGKNGDYGILTEKDLLRLIAGQGEKILGNKSGKYKSTPLLGIQETDHLYKAISRMAAANISHLAVFDGSGKIAGAITNRDLLKQRALDASVLGDNIEQADSPEQLATIWPELTRTARSLMFEQVDVRNIASIISHELRALTKRSCELAEAEMVSSGRGKAPLPWTMMVLGSGGRGESLLAMDQDNAIIYAKGAPDGPEDAWFAEMGHRATLILHQVGVPLCKGNIMASNSEWRMSSKRWRSTIREWITRSNPQDILNSDIFFDAASVCGNHELLDTLEKDAVTVASKSRNFIKLLSMNAANFPESLGWFGKIRTKNGRIDIKRAGLMPVFSTARVLAIRHRITKNSTPARLDAVAEKEPGKVRQLENLKESHRIFLELILKQQLHDLDIGIPIGNSISPEVFGGFEIEQLQWALEQIKAIPDLLGVSVRLS